MERQRSSALRLVETTPLRVRSEPWRSTRRGPRSPASSRTCATCGARWTPQTVRAKAPTAIRDRRTRRLTASSQEISYHACRTGSPPHPFGRLNLAVFQDNLTKLLDDLRKTFGPHAELCVSSSSAPNLRKYLRALKVRCRTSLEIGCPCRRLCHCTPAQWPPTTLAGPSAAAGRRRRLAEQPQRYQRCPGGRGPGADA